VAPFEPKWLSIAHLEIYCDDRYELEHIYCEDRYDGVTPFEWLGLCGTS
jgi:hypothetical protein